MSGKDNETAGERPVTGRLRAMFPFDWELLKHAGAEPIPRHLKKWWFCLGGTVLYLFVVQVVTGIALTFYYVPSPDEAHASVAAITREIRFGWFIRSLHKWAANLMIVAVMLTCCGSFSPAPTAIRGSSTGVSDSCCWWRP